MSEGRATVDVQCLIDICEAPFGPARRCLRFWTLGRQSLRLYRWRIGFFIVPLTEPWTSSPSSHVEIRNPFVLFSAHCHQLLEGVVDPAAPAVSINGGGERGAAYFIQVKLVSFSQTVDQSAQDSLIFSALGILYRIPCFKL